MQTPEQRRASNARHYAKNASRQVERNRANRRRNAEFVQAAKADRPCADCGGRYPAFVMDFDHRGDDAKVADVSDMVQRGYSLASLRAEIEKCDLVCANCHRIRTWHRMSNAVESETSRP